MKLGISVIYRQTHLARLINTTCMILTAWYAWCSGNIKWLNTQNKTYFLVVTWKPTNLNKDVFLLNGKSLTSLVENYKAI